MAGLHRQSENGWRIRGTAWLLLLIFLLPFAQMAYGATADPEAGLLACCRSHGKHKCLLRSSLTAHSDADKHAIVRVPQLSEKCPCTPVNPSSTNISHAGLPEVQRLTWNKDAAAFLHARRAVQRSDLRTRANPKRGPPSSSIVA